MTPSRPGRSSPWLALLALAAIGVGLAGALARPARGAEPEERSAQSFYLEGFRRHRAGDLGGAIVHFQWALQVDPEHPHSLLALARIYQEEFEQTMQSFEKSSQLYDALNRSLEANPPAEGERRFYLSYYYHGLLDLKGGEYQHAIDNLSLALELVPDLIDEAKAFNAIGVAHYYLQRYPAASEFFRLALDADPAYDLARFNLWSVSTRMFLFHYVENLLEGYEDPQSVLDNLERLRTLAPRFAGGRLLEARLLREMGHSAEALQLLAAVLARDEDDPLTWSVRTEMARICLELKDRDRARRLLWENLRRFPELAAEHGHEVLDLLDLVQSDAQSDFFWKEGAGDDPVAEAVPRPAASLPPAELDPGHAKLDCKSCHMVQPELGPPVDCDECHFTVTHIHPVAVKTEMILQPGFPPGRGGKLACGTCHQLHGGETGTRLLRFAGPGAGRTRSDFCAQCHGRELTGKNPHRGELGRDRCGYCHTSSDRAQGAATATAQVCSFCHDMGGGRHPSNTYFFDDPMGEKQGVLQQDRDCVTCHEPHGTTFTTHFLKNAVALYVERRRVQDPHVPLGFACTYCHTRGSAEEIAAAEGNALRYGGDVGQLCVTCHLQEEGHHPMGVRVGEAEIQPGGGSAVRPLLNALGRIDCSTCHDNSCSSGQYTMAPRGTGDESHTRLCWRCHNRRQFVARSPHVDQRKYCRYCHEDPPATRDFQGYVKKVPEGVCLHCHDGGPHPMGADHLRLPTQGSPPPADLPLADSGEITCITCHEPHAVEGDVPRRLRATGRELCQKCHTKHF